MIIYVRREGDKIFIHDRKTFTTHLNKKNLAIIGHPEFALVAEDLLEGSVEKLFKDMDEGRPYKMVLKRWPIE